MRSRAARLRSGERFSVTATPKNRIMIFGPKEDGSMSPAVAAISGEARLRSTSHEEDTMRPVPGLFVAIAALTIFSPVAEAADGCGRGMYYNGRRCVRVRTTAR